MRAINLGLRFLLELAMLGALGYWGFTSHTGLLRWVLGLGAPLAAATIWGMWIAPKAPQRLADPLRLGLEIALFAAAALALWAADRPGAAIVFAVVVSANLLLLTLWKQR